MGIMYKFPIDGLTEMPEDYERRMAALDNILACRKALEGFGMHASSELMQELTEAVDRYEDRVREFHGMEPRK